MCSCGGWTAGGWSPRSGRQESRPGLWALPKGRIGPGESGEATALREVAEETGAHGRSLGKLGDVRYWFNWEGERVFKVVSFFLVRYEGGRLGDLAEAFRHEVAEVRWLPLAEAPAAAGLPGRARDGRAGAALARAGRMIAAPVPAFALNFYSPIVEAQLRSHRKTATIRLGDKSRKYPKGMIVSVLVGARYGPRQHVFDAVIDKVEVKRLGELSPREIEHDNPEVRRPEEMAHFLGQLYNREVSDDDTVTVIRFSAVKPSS